MRLDCPLKSLVMQLLQAGAAGKSRRSLSSVAHRSWRQVTGPLGRDRSQGRHILRVVAVVPGVLDPGHDAPTPAILHRTYADHIHRGLRYTTVAFLDRQIRLATNTKITP